MTAKAFWSTARPGSRTASPRGSASVRRAVIVAVRSGEPTVGASAPWTLAFSQSAKVAAYSGTTSI
ncbi:hypothetical protein STANM309S_00383 [Streptomyces tanashiensis]